MPGVSVKVQAQAFRPSDGDPGPPPTLRAPSRAGGVATVDLAQVAADVGQGRTMAQQAGGQRMPGLVSDVVTERDRESRPSGRDLS